MGTNWAILAGVGIAVIVIVFMLVYASRYTKVGPNEVLVVSGRKRRTADGKIVGFRLVMGGGTFVWPIFERVDILSLEIMTIDVKTPDVYTSTGVPVVIDGVAQVKIKGDDLSIRTASEQFLSKSTDEMMNVALQTLEGHLRAIIGTLTVEDIYRNREAFAQKAQEYATNDFANMGLQIVSFTIRDIRDNVGYLDALGKPRTAQVKRDAVIGQAEADRDATIRSASAQQAGQEARFAAEAQIALAQRDYEIKRAEYQASVNIKKAEQDLAYELQKNKTSQLVKAEEVRIISTEKERMIEVQEKEVQRRTRELEATIQKPADAEKYRVQTIADASRYQIEAEATGRAQAARQMGMGEADALRAKGMAEADVILAQGQATAEAMRKKADAWKQYNEAAISQMLIERLPDLARAIAEPLAKTEKIVIINTGGGSGEGAGASKITKDIIDIIAQLPPVLEGVSGLNLKDLISKVTKVSGEKGEGKK